MTQIGGDELEIGGVYTRHGRSLYEARSAGRFAHCAGRRRTCRSHRRSARKFLPRGGLHAGKERSRGLYETAARIPDERSETQRVPVESHGPLLARADTAKPERRNIRKKRITGSAETGTKKPF